MQCPHSDQTFANGSAFHAGSQQSALALKVANRLIDLEYKGGDLDGALRRLETETGISFWTWRRWRRCGRRMTAPGVLGITLNRLLEIYVVKCARRVRAAQQELDAAKVLTGNDQHKGAMGHDAGAELLAIEVGRNFEDGLA